MIPASATTGKIPDRGFVPVRAMQLTGFTAIDDIRPGPIPITSVRRLTSPLTRSIGLVLCRLVRCWARKVM